MSPLPSQHPSLAIHLCDAIFTPIITSSRTQPQLEALTSLASAADAARQAALLFGLGEPGRIVVEHFRFPTGTDPNAATEGNQDALGKDVDVAGTTQLAPCTDSATKTGPQPRSSAGRRTPNPSRSSIGIQGPVLTYFYLPSPQPPPQSEAPLSAAAAADPDTQSPSPMPNGVVVPRVTPNSNLFASPQFFFRHTSRVDSEPLSPRAVAASPPSPSGYPEADAFFGTAAPPITGIIIAPTAADAPEARLASAKLEKVALALQHEWPNINLDREAGPFVWGNRL